ncbi:hypothetical protein JKP88DRAFT_294636 [Tribonema minus]|uniref:Uncharacterized protein n=1 Tax=Tribonema minus TaxID=303371 RepID=A0A835ZCK7_9STRA|nr:hypothetical protein JKP88DRAFT_294636 [Tribonema minus]
MGDNCAKVLACMKAHQGDAGIARWGTQAVGRLLHQALFSGDQELEACQIKLADGGACQIMVGAMNDHADKADVQMHGTTALLHLSVGNDRNCRALGEAGACEALMAAVRRFTVGVAWQQDAAGAIASLGAVPSHVEVLVAGGACTFVLAVLQANLHDARTMSMALPAVGVLSRQYAIALIASGACKTVVQALNAHLDNSHIQLKGLAALVHLARVDAARLRLVSADAGVAAVRTMRAYPADPLLQLQAVAIIAILSFDNEAYAAQLTGMGGCALVTASLSTRLNSAEYQQTALEALSKLAVSTTASREDVAAACAAAVTSLSAYPDDEDVNVAALLVLASLAGVTNSCALHDCDACAAVASAMRRYPHSQSIQTCGAQVLQHTPRRSQRAK